MTAHRPPDHHDMMGERIQEANQRLTLEFQGFFRAQEVERLASETLEPFRSVLIMEFTGAVGGARDKRASTAVLLGSRAPQVRGGAGCVGVPLRSIHLWSR